MSELENQRLEYLEHLRIIVSGLRTTNSQMALLGMLMPAAQPQQKVLVDSIVNMSTLYETNTRPVVASLQVQINEIQKRQGAQPASEEKGSAKPGDYDKEQVAAESRASQVEQIQALEEELQERRGALRDTIGIATPAASVGGPSQSDGQPG